MLEYLILIAALQTDCFDEVLRQWRSDDPAAREAASREVVRRWSEWTELDVAKLDAAANDPEGEVAARAGDAQNQVLLRRRFDRPLWPKIEKADSLLERLNADGARSSLLGWAIPGGPCFHPGPLTNELRGLGPEVEAYLRSNLADPAVRAEIALVLAETGGIDSLPALIAAIPEEDGFTYTCVVYALWKLTHQSIGIDSRMTEGWAPDVPARWHRWYEERRDYLYAASGSIAIDVEAWALGTPTRDYRKKHPWIRHEEIKELRDGPEYERRLREFAVSFLLRSAWKFGRFDKDVLKILGEVEDPRCLAAIRRLASEPWTHEDSNVAWVSRALRRKAPETIPDLVKLLAATKGEHARFVRIPLTWVRLEERFGPGLLSSRVESSEVLFLQDCLEGKERIATLISKLQVPAPDEGFIEIAGFVDSPQVAAALEALLNSTESDPVDRICAATSLGRLGRAGSVEFLTTMLGHDKPHVRLEAAEGLWRLGDRGGLLTLLKLLKLRPLEDGRTSSGVRTIVPPHQTSSLYVVRRSCELLGDFGDPSAVGPIKGLLSENLNGCLRRNSGSGTGWYGRPDVVALAKLGDFSAMDEIIESIRCGDPLMALGGYEEEGDLIRIGFKRYARDLVPLLKAGGPEQRDLYAARAIVLLLDKGK